MVQRQKVTEPEGVAIRILGVPDDHVKNHNVKIAKHSLNIL